MSTRWNSRGGYKEALSIGFPLVISMVSATVMQFTDRIFLGNYSINALAASVPAGIAAFLFMSFFMGVVEYINVFVAQYTGAGRPERVGAALWQGLWFCVPAGVILSGIGLLGEDLFRLAGHPPEVYVLEGIYFKIISLGFGPGLIAVSLSCFFSGRGITKPVMVVNTLGAMLNIPLDYALINGVWGCPELGIAGAGLATVASQIVTAVFFGCLVLTKEHERCFRVRSNWRIDKALMARFFRFGLPGGVQFFVDMFAISFFVFMVGRLGTVELTATNIAISLDLLSFLPMIGMSVAASVMTGQAMGHGTPARADYATGTVLRIALIYMGIAGVVFVVFPQYLIGLYQPRNMSLAEFAPVVVVGTNLLRIMAAFVLVDAVAIIHMGALKGAGDISFIMKTMILAALFVMVLPIFIMQQWFDVGVYGPWVCLFFYVITLATAFRIRFKKGKWRTMRVIEEAPQPVAS